MSLTGFSESENNAVVPVYAKAPIFLLKRLKFFLFRRWMERILAKEFFAALGFPLNGEWELAVAPKEFFSVINFGHRRRSSRRSRRRLVLRSAISLSEREMLPSKLELNNPRLAAKRSSLSASISTMMSLDFGFLSSVMVATTFILSVGIRKSIWLDPCRFHEPLTTVREGGRSALECGSLLPLYPRPACWPQRGAWAGEAASKLAGSKRQQAAALQSVCFRGSE